MQHQPWILILALLSVSLLSQDPPTIQDPDTGLSGDPAVADQTPDLGWIDILSNPSTPADQFKAPDEDEEDTDPTDPADTADTADPATTAVTTYTVPPDRILHLRLVMRRVDGLGGVLEGQVTVNGVRVDRSVGGSFGLNEGDVSGATDGTGPGILFEGEIAHAGDVVGLGRLGTGALEEAGFILRGFLEVATR